MSISFTLIPSGRKIYPQIFIDYIDPMSIQPLLSHNVQGDEYWAVGVIIFNGSSVSLYLSNYPPSNIPFVQYPDFVEIKPGSYFSLMLSGNDIMNVKLLYLKNNSDGYVFYKVIVLTPYPVQQQFPPPAPSPPPSPPSFMA